VGDGLGDGVADRDGGTAASLCPGPADAWLRTTPTTTATMTTSAAPAHAEIVVHRHRRTMGGCGLGVVTVLPV
jgi:hypothetical protein